ncbi:hypothetical protein [Actinacidiphila oryziradicis]|nr:hypothetical protein [Actinacidiphila oryziradicis]
MKPTLQESTPHSEPHEGARPMPGGSYGIYVGTSSTQLPLRTQISIK